MKRNLYILLTLFAVLLAGCEHKDFCCRCLQADDVEVVFDWSLSTSSPTSMEAASGCPPATTAPCVSTATRNSCITNTLTASTPSVPVPAEACRGSCRGRTAKSSATPPTGYGPTGSRHSPSGTARTSGVSSSAPLPRSAGTPWRYAMSPTSVTSAVRVASAVR